jgi:hypothetical protein
MWARVKGRTENKLTEMFRDLPAAQRAESSTGSGAYMFRPGYMKPVKGQKNVLKFYFGWQLLYPLMKLVIPKFTCTLNEVGRAMVSCAVRGYSKNILEVKDIIEAAK